jgi:hypothetical protein
MQLLQPMHFAGDGIAIVIETENFSTCYVPFEQFMVVSCWTGTGAAERRALNSVK